MFYFLRESMAVKRRDAWVTVLFVDPFALPFAHLLARSAKWITPDHLSVFACVSFACGVLSLFNGSDVVIPLLLFGLSVLLDCTDGKLARILGWRTSYGALLDLLCDWVIHFVGFGLIALWHLGDGNWLSAFLVACWSIYFCWLHVAQAQQLAGVYKPQAASAAVSRKYRWGWRLENSPLSEVEFAFLIIPASILKWQYWDALCITATALLLMQRFFSMRKRGIGAS